MKKTNLGSLIILPLLVISNILLAFPWPLGNSVPDPVNNYTIMKNYGAMNVEWSAAGPSTTNFHSGVDFWQQDIDLDRAYTVEPAGGFVTDVWPSLDSPNGNEYKVIICSSVSADEGFAYKHLNSKSGVMWLEDIWLGYEYNPGDSIAKMEISDLQHLHFQVAFDKFSNGDYGLENPLIHLVPAATSGENFVWNLISDGLQNDLEIFFLRDYPAFDDPNNQDWEHLWSTGEDVRNSVLNSESLDGSVDLFFNIGCTAHGEIGYPKSIA